MQSAVIVPVVLNANGVVSILSCDVIIYLTIVQHLLALSSTSGFYFQP